jgi:hypothetical protein
MKTSHKILLGSIAAVALATAAPSSAYADRHGHYVNHRGHYGYYYRHSFYAYNAGPYPYYYGPFTPPGVVVAGPGPTVVIAPRRHRFFFWF